MTLFENNVTESRVYTLRGYQQEASDAAIKFFNDPRKKSGIIVLPTGCHEKGHEIRMHNGSIKKVEDIVVGDKLMGIDSTSREVLKLHRGRDEMYRITPKNNLKPFVVNGGHVLHLEKTKEHKNDINKLLDISVNEYLTKSKWFKHIHKLRYSACISFNNSQSIELDPYFLGVYLGDGSSANGSVSITSPDSEIISLVYSFSEKYKLGVRVSRKKCTDCCSYFLTKKHADNNGSNYLKEQLVDLGVYKKIAHEKHVPKKYLYSSVENRFDLLAGLLDTDGSLDKNKGSFEFSSKSLQLCKDVQFLARSLGFFCNIGKIKVVKGQNYYRVQLTGYLHLIPNRIERKKYNNTERQKSNLRHGFSIEKVGVGDYYGFTLNKDHLYMDSEFLIHHNSGKSLVIADIVNKLDGNTVILQHSKEILEQNHEKFLSYDPYANVSVFSASFDSKEISKVTYATIGSVNNKRELFSHFDNVIIDECHQTNAKTGMYKKFFDMLGNKKFLGLTATPYRSFTNSFGTQLRFTTRTRPRLFEEVLYYSQISDLKREGYLAEMEYYPMQNGFDTNMLQVNSTRMDYTDNSVQEYYHEINFEQQIADVVERLLKAGRKSVLVFTKFINESEAVQELLGDKARVVSAYTDKKERAETLRLFKAGVVKIVLNCSAMGIGFDYPALDTILMAQPTRSLIRWYQFVGRAFRPHPSKKSAWIVDMCGTYDRFGKVEQLTMASDGNGKWFYHSDGKRLTNVFLD